MLTARLGKTRLVVNRLGFGGIPIQRLPPARAIRLVQEAIDRGVNFFDTARAYADSEDKIGRALGRRRRDRIILATKTRETTAAGMAAAIDLSLKDLRTDRIDLYQIHGIDSWAEWQKAISPRGALAAMRQAKKAGKIRFIGITSHSRDLLTRVLRETADLIDTIQSPFNFVGDESARTLLPLARRQDIGFIAMKPLGDGVLERPDLALRYVLQFEGLVTIPGMETLAELRQNLRLAAKFEPLNAAELRQLRVLRRKLGRSFCRKCGYCQPCPEGIVIHLALGAETLLKRFNRTGIASWCKAAMRKATACRQCGICETRCPYHLPIRRLLKQNVALYRRRLYALKIPWDA